VSPASVVVPAAPPAGSLSFVDDDRELRRPSLRLLRLSRHLPQSLLLRLLPQLHRLHLLHRLLFCCPLAGEAEVVHSDQSRSAAERTNSTRFRHLPAALEFDFSAGIQTIRFSQQEIQKPRVVPGWTRLELRQSLRSGIQRTN